MKTYDEILSILDRNDIKPKRWFVIDHIFYYAPLNPPDKADMATVSTLFTWADYFPQMGVWSIDMDLQPDSKETREKKELAGKTLVQRTSYKERRIGNIEFDL